MEIHCIVYEDDEIKSQESMNKIKKYYGIDTIDFWCYLLIRTELVRQYIHSY